MLSRACYGYRGTSTFSLQYFLDDLYVYIKGSLTQNRPNAVGFFFGLWGFCIARRPWRALFIGYEHFYFAKNSAFFGWLTNSIIGLLK